MNNRIKEIRNDLKLSRIAFGKRLGVSGDVINNLERGRVEPKDPIIKLICSEYSVNEEWLRTGKGSMFIEPDTFSLDDYVKQHGGSDVDLQIVKAYFELPPEVRTLLIERFKNVLAAPAAAEDMSVEKAEDLYKKNVLSSVQNTDFTASNTIGDNVKEERKTANEG